jgi:hypothetical protein
VRTAVSIESLLPSGEGQDEGSFTAIIPLTLTLSQREREYKRCALFAGLVSGHSLGEVVVGSLDVYQGTVARIQFVSELLR